MGGEVTLLMPLKPVLRNFPNFALWTAGRKGIRAEKPFFCLFPQNLVCEVQNLVFSEISSGQWVLPQTALITWWIRVRSFLTFGVKCS